VFYGPGRYWWGTFDYNSSRRFPRSPKPRVQIGTAPGAANQARDVSLPRARMAATVSSTVMAEVSSQSPILGVS